MSKPFDFGGFEMSGSAGLDALLGDDKPKVARVERKKVASLGDITDFVRVSAESLIHRSSRDLWALKKQADGTYYIERLFDNNGEPLKG